MTTRVWAELRKRSLLELLCLPVVVAAAIGGAYSAVGQNWILLFGIVGTGAALIATSLIVDARGKLTNISNEIRQLTTLIEMSTARSAYVGACCMPSSSDDLALVPDKIARARAVSNQRELEEALVDLTAAIAPNRRIAIYYGDTKRLTCARQSAWTNGTPPVLVNRQSASSDTLFVPDLLDRMAKGEWLYIPDVTKPDKESIRFTASLPGGHDFRTFACFPIRVQQPPTDGEKAARLAGALMLQHPNADALATVAQRNLLAMLCNLTGSTFVHGLRVHGG